MQFSETFILAFIAFQQLVSAAPAPSADDSTIGPHGQHTVKSVSHGWEFNDFSGSLSTKSGSKRSLAKRNSDYVSTCGSEWLPINNFRSNSRSYIGYEAAVNAFCQHITTDFDGRATVVGMHAPYSQAKDQVTLVFSTHGDTDYADFNILGHGAYAGTTIYKDASGKQIGITEGGDPSTSGSPGHIECE